MSSILRIIGPCDCSCVFREKAILAVSLLSDRDELLAHASFSDHPIGDLVDQAEWEPFVQHISGSKKYKVWLKDMLWENCLLYCEMYEQVEDHDDVMKVFFEQTKLQTLVDNPFFLTELIETQNELQHTAVCEVLPKTIYNINLQEKKEMQRKEEEVRKERGELSHSHKAFTVQFFAIDKNYEPRYKRHHDRDLCLVTVPTLAPEMPLLHNFTRIFPKDMCAPAHELYGLHRIFWVLCLSLSQNRVPLQCFVAQVGTQLVGVVVIRDEQEVEFLRAHYNIENFIYFSHHSYQEHAALLHFVLRSTVRHCCHLLFREVLRLSHKSCLYHREYPPNSPSWVRPGLYQTSCINPLDFLLDRAVPVKPRPQMDYPLEELGINAPSNQITDPQAPFALLLISRKLTLEQKVVVNARITVCGASETGLSLLETLCCCPHLRFNNLTLVSTHGFHGDRSRDNSAEDVCFSHAFSSRDVALLPLSSVKTVCGKVVSIDRKSKHVQVCSDRKSTPVHVPSGYWLSYDILVLCSGLQYQVWPTTLLGSYVPFLLGSGPVPPNLWTLEDPEDRVRARLWVQEQLRHALIWSLCVSLEHIVVYGDNIDAFTTVHALLSLGLTGPQIHLVLAPSESGSWLLDPAVDQAVDLNLEKVQVQVYKNYVLQNIRIQENQVTSATFNYNGEIIEICCGVSPGLVPVYMLRSLLDSFLVVDGRLVVDRCFHTSDPRIWAAGPITKFSRRYHSEEWCHQRFCSGEVGQDLARQILLLFDPTVEPREESELLPVYKRPKLKDSALVTGRANLGSYFRLQLGDSEQVESLTCASFKPLPLHNLLCLYGQQQSLLGNLSTRFSLGQVPDLYSFFRQSWCLAIFHDRFSDFQQELRAMAHHSATDTKVWATYTYAPDHIQSCHGVLFGYKTI
uniref:CFAP61 dimerisation domain-containing protein n=1 Tax=Periophthalmus magnuspinnatus TaxID=409849 RepID=A0A3B3ZSJ5_9GOBI